MVSDIPNKDAKKHFDLSSPNIIPILSDLLNSGVSVRIRVTGASMRPFLHGGETVTIHPVSAQAFRVGDIVLFRGSDNYPIMHRIVRLCCSEEVLKLQTKGDANVTLDVPIDTNQVLGKVIRISSSQSVNGQDSMFSIDLNQPWRRYQAIYIARWEMFRYYLYRLRILLKS